MSRARPRFVPVLFRRELDLQQRFFAMGEAIAHLNHLWRAGRLARLVAATARSVCANLITQPSIRFSTLDIESPECPS